MSREDWSREKGDPYHAPSRASSYESSIPRTGRPFSHHLNHSKPANNRPNLSQPSSRSPYSEAQNINKPPHRYDPYGYGYNAQEHDHQYPSPFIGSRQHQPKTSPLPHYSVKEDRSHPNGNLFRVNSKSSPDKGEINNNNIVSSSSTLIDADQRQTSNFDLNTAAERDKKLPHKESSVPPKTSNPGSREEFTKRILFFSPSPDQDKNSDKNMSLPQHKHTGHHEHGPHPSISRSASPTSSAPRATSNSNAAPNPRDTSHHPHQGEQYPPAGSVYPSDTYSRRKDEYYAQPPNQSRASNERNMYPTKPVQAMQASRLAYEQDRHIQTSLSRTPYPGTPSGTSGGYHLPPGQDRRNDGYTRSPPLAGEHYGENVRRYEDEGRHSYGDLNNNDEVRARDYAYPPPSRRGTKRQAGYDSHHPQFFPSSLDRQSRHVDRNNSSPAVNSSAVRYCTPIITANERRRSQPNPTSSESADSMFAADAGLVNGNVRNEKYRNSPPEIPPQDDNPYVKGTQENAHLRHYHRTYPSREGAPASPTRYNESSPQRRHISNSSPPTLYATPVLRRNPRAIPSKHDINYQYASHQNHDANKENQYAMPFPPSYPYRQCSNTGYYSPYDHEAGAEYHHPLAEPKPYPPSYALPHPNKRLRVDVAVKSKKPTTKPPRRKKMYSDHVGVTYNKTHAKFQACITHYRKQHYLGRYKLAVDAARAYDESAKLLKGNGWKINFQRIEDYECAKATELAKNDKKRSASGFKIPLAPVATPKINVPLSVQETVAAEGGAVMARHFLFGNETDKKEESKKKVTLTTDASQMDIEEKMDKNMNDEMNALENPVTMIKEKTNATTCSDVNQKITSLSSAVTPSPHLQGQIKPSSLLTEPLTSTLCQSDADTPIQKDIPQSSLKSSFIPDEEMSVGLNFDGTNSSTLHTVNINEPIKKDITPLKEQTVLGNDNVKSPSIKSENFDTPIDANITYQSNNPRLVKIGTPIDNLITSSSLLQPIQEVHSTNSSNLNLVDSDPPIQKSKLPCLNQPASDVKDEASGKLSTINCQQQLIDEEKSTCSDKLDSDEISLNSTEAINKIESKIDQNTNNSSPIALNLVTQQSEIVSPDDKESLTAQNSRSIETRTLVDLVSSTPSHNSKDLDCETEIKDITNAIQCKVKSQSKPVVTPNVTLAAASALMTLTSISSQD